MLSDFDENDQRGGRSAVVNAGLAAEYFLVAPGTSWLSQIDFAAPPAATAVVGALDHAKSYDPFWDGGPADNFAARYTGALQVETAGLYTLYLSSDDGSALYLDGVRVIDNDGAHSVTTRTVTLDLEAGAHTVEILYFERSGNQALHLEWQGPDSGGVRQTINGTALVHETEPAAPEAPEADLTPEPETAEVDAPEPGALEMPAAPDFVSGLAAEYFLIAPGTSSLSQIDFTATPEATAVVGALDYAEGHMRFWEDGASNNFAARYTGALQVETAGRYTLYLTSDDGSALYLDGVRVIDNDGAHATKLRTVTVDLEAGAHALEILYFERTGKQALQLEWQGPDSGGVRQTIGGTSLVRDGTGQVVPEPETDVTPEPEAVSQISVAGQSYDLRDHDVAQQGTAMHTVNADGSSLTLTDNGWKAIQGSFDVTADTVLSFTFSANVIGEIHGIGFANGDKVANKTFFQLAGTQSWGLQGADWQYVSGSGEVSVSIRVGEYFTGSFDRLVFGMDDDMEVGADSSFANVDIRLSEPEPEVPDTPTAEPEAPGVDVTPEAPQDDEAGENLEVNSNVTVDGGRVTIITPGDIDVAAMRVLDQPEHGHVSVNPDNTIALVLTGSDYVGRLDFRYETIDANGTVTQHNVALDVTPGAQEAGWGTGVNHYMLATDADDRVIVEHGEVHRKVYVSQEGLTAADIAALEGVAESVVTARWLRNTHPEYGSSEATALHPDLGFGLWYEINPRGSEASNWLLMERGYEYAAGRLFPREASGESELHPMFIGAWGDGDAPRLTAEAMMFQADVKNIVVQNIELLDGMRALGDHENILFESMIFTGHEIVIQGQEISGITIRDTIFQDAWTTTIVDGDGDGFWDALAARKSGMYAAGIDGLLFDGVIFDHNGWAPDFSPDGSVDGGHPPSMFSHNLYLQWNTTDVTMRDSITMRAASFGAQFRGGAYLEDNLFLNNNIAFNLIGGDYGGRGPIGNYSLINGNLVTSAAFRGEDSPMIGALSWGIQNEALLTSLINNIVAHAVDPDNSVETNSRGTAVLGKGAESVYTDSTIIWRWGDPNVNTDALDPFRLDATTIQRYAADLLGVDVATINDLAQYLRDLDGAEYAAATADILTYFRAGFGLDATARSSADTLRFMPDARGDGVRWDNRLNWDSDDLPGTVDGDSVDLGGNKVIFGGTVVLDDMRFGTEGGLTLTHGRLEVTGTLTGDAGATLDIDRAGQFWTNGAIGVDLLEVAVAGGRFVNAGLFESPVTLTATGGQTILATGGAEFRVNAQSRIDIGGGTTKIGFDGNGDEAAILRFQVGATLGFTAADGTLSTLEEFRSGAFGDAPTVQSGVDLGGAVLDLDLTGLIATDTLALIEVDELIGTFGDVTVQGLGDRDAAINIDYEADTVWLQLTQGSGQTSVSQSGTQDMVDAGYAALWEMLSTSEYYEL